MLYQRKIVSEISQWIFKKEIIILNGPRQVGKTSLLQILKNELIKKGVSDKNIFYFNLEATKILNPLNEDPENILKYITAPDKTNFFFLDEIQYLDNPSNFLKLLYDKYAGRIKIIATGSSSLEIKAKLQDSLAGRKAVFWIKPLDFSEFLLFKKFTFRDYLDKKDLPPEIKSSFDDALREYLVFGGMPAVVLEPDKKLKQKMLEGYVDDYVNKDIRAIGRIDNIARFNSAVKILASQIGNLLNVSELANTAGVARREAEKYLDLLEFTFVLDRVPPFRKNIRAQVVKMPKIYFFDLGVRNAVLGNFLDLSARSDGGYLFENFVFLEIKKQNIGRIFFYRTASKAEIDFIIEKSGKIILLEAKYKKLNKTSRQLLMENFIAKSNNIAKAVLVNIDLNARSNFIEYVDYRFAVKITNEGNEGVL